MAVDLIRGDFGVKDDSGSGGLAAVGVNTYGYQSVHLDHDTVEVMDWVAQHPNARWVVEVYRDGEKVGLVSTDSPNVDGYNQVQPPDGTKQYGNGIWWRLLVPLGDFEIGDEWFVYGWDEMQNGGPYPTGYPPLREYNGDT